MVNDGIWEKIDKSSWAHPMVSVPKPNGQIRITTDLTSLNKFVIPDRYPLPNAKDLFLELSRANVYSKLDMKKGYFHVVLDPACRHLTATLTHSGLYQYIRLPMGLKDSASVFQRLVSQTLGDCDGTIAYLDDILIFGASLEEHDARLERVLSKLAKNDFRLNLAKCEFGTHTVRFLGHVISHNSIKPDVKNTEAIANAPTPRSAKEVQSFLGMINFYHDFIPNLASISEPLRRLLRKRVRFSWSNVQQSAFDALKRKAAENLSVNIFDPNCRTYVTVDASDSGLGAVLSQVQQGKEVPICFASHTLQPHERRYATNERECLACIWACEKWEKFLIGRKFILRTDHSALKILLKEHRNGRQSAKFSRWLTRLEHFEYEIEHHSGKDNHVADALSRLPLDSSVPAIENDHDPCVVRFFSQDGISLSDIQRQTKTDSTMTKIFKYFGTNWPNQRSISAEERPFFRVKDELSLENGYILRGEDRIVVPPTLRRKLLHLAHKGHPGIVRMKRKVRETYWWPTLNTDIERLVKHCQACQASGKSHKAETIPEISISRPEEPWKKLAIDIAGPFYNAPHNKRFIVTVIDYFSRFPEVLLTDNITSKSIISWLQCVFSRFGNPDSIVSDNGPQFVSSEFEDFLRSRNIKHIRSSVYTPQQNGLVESFNRVLKYGIQAFGSTNQCWQRGIEDLLASYRASSSSPGEKSPGELFFGRRLRLAFEQVRRNGTCETKKPTSKEPTTAEREEPDCVPTSLPTNRGPYRMGDLVLAKRPHVLKGQSPYSKPLRVEQVLGQWTYRLSDGQVWNARRLRRYFPPVEDDTFDFDHSDNSASGAQNDSRSLLPRRSHRRAKGRPPLRFSPY